MTKKRVSICVVAMVFAVLPIAAQAEISWVGGTSTDIFDEANWDLSSSSVTVIDPNVTISDDAVIGPGPFANDPVIPDVPNQERFQLDDGKTLTLDSVSLTVAGNDGVGGVPETENGPVVNVIGGGQFDPFFVVNGVQVNIDGSSTATFGGGGNPINLSTLDLTPGAVLSFLAETPDAYRAEHLSKTFVLGSPAIEGANIMVASDGAAGSIITVIPEPSSVVLASLGMLSLLFLRRKN